MVSMAAKKGARRTRRKFTPEFKVDAVRLVLVEGKGIAEVAVDDEQTHLRALSRALRPISDRLEFVTTTSVIHAPLKVGEERFDGLLVDLNMPEFDGLAVTSPRCAPTRRSRT